MPVKSAHPEKWHAMHDVNACETGLRLYCESVKTVIKLHVKFLVYDVSIIHCDTIALLIVNCHLTLWNLHAAQPHLYKISNDCMYASWNLYCHCSATQSPAICDRVALFIATGSPCLLRQGRLVFTQSEGKPITVLQQTLSCLSHENGIEILWL